MNLFSPNTIIASAKVNQNFADIQDGSALNNAAILSNLLGIVDNAGQSVNFGQIGGTGNYWRLQMGNATTAADGGNGFVAISPPIPLADITNAFFAAWVSGVSGVSDYGYYVSHTSIGGVNSFQIRVTSVQVAPVSWLLWGQTAS